EDAGPQGWGRPIEVHPRDGIGSASTHSSSERVAAADKFIGAHIGSLTGRALVSIDILATVRHLNASVNGWRMFCQVEILGGQVAEPGWCGLCDIALYRGLLVWVWRPFQDRAIRQVILDIGYRGRKAIFNSPVNRMFNRLIVIDRVVPH